MSDNTETNKVPLDPNQVGEMLPQEMVRIQQIRGRINQCLVTVGHLEVQKAMKIAECGELEQEGQAIIASARERLQLDPQDTLQLTPDGRLLRASKAQPEG